MATNVIMPQLGESVVEGTVTKWLVKVGDNIEEFQPLLEVSTDKVDTEVPAPASGQLLAIYVQEGQTVEAGVLLAVIGAPGESPESAGDGGSTHVPHGAPAHSAPEPAMSHAAPVMANGETSNGNRLVGMRISPVVARMAAEHNLDLAVIPGTGREGRITKKDVENFLAGAVVPVIPAQPSTADLPPWEQPGSGDLFKPTGEFKKTTPAPQPVAAPAPTVAAKPAPPPRAIPAEPIPTGVPGELVSLSNMRRAIADHMVRSKLHTSPHVTTVFEIDMTAALTHRAAHKDQYAKNGVNLTLTAYFISAMVTACQRVPIINSQWTDEGIYLHNNINIGMAVAIDDGLIVPVIKNAQELNLMGLARQVNDLAVRGRNRQLKPDEVQGGTITITNHGVSGSLFATPIINQPQAAIFGVGVMEKRVKVINDAIAIRPCVYASLTFDHRIADGATGDAWLATVKQVLESWS
jgi:2-oxoglutarate dehydrogenase E2 component (dihydrolipoamide succinyltransferase)